MKANHEKTVLDRGGELRAGANGDCSDGAAGNFVQQTVSCIYCGGRTQFINETMRTCVECESFVAVEPRPRYEDGYHAYRFSFLRPKLYYLGLKALRMGLKRGLTVCDIGCGAGHSLWWAKKLGCKTIGFDILSAYWHTRGSDLFYFGTEELIKEQSCTCDLVWCWHTLEHSDNPESLIALAAAILKPGGSFYLEFPEAWRMALRHGKHLAKASLFPEHRGLPSVRWAKAMCLKHGLTVVSARQPKNPSWLYLKADDNADVVIHCTK